MKIFGIELPLKLHYTLIVRLMGGLGNQMFQYAFGRALAHKTGNKVIYDLSWFPKAQQTIVNDKGENDLGVVMRKYALDIFNINVPAANNYQLHFYCKRTNEKASYIYDEDLLKSYPFSVYKGYFQNENYFKEYRDEIKNDFTFPKIKENDEFNTNWLNKIHACENPVFIHIRRGDYLNLGCELSTNYYKNAIQYIQNNVQNPTFFVFGQEVEDYIKNEFDVNIPFETIGEINTQNKEDWKDIVLMQECKHAILANSSFSWWAAWLGKANDGIVVAPTPWGGGKDEIICDNWMKIER